MGQSIVQIDAFASKAFGGNPAAICLLSEPRSEEWMQNVALEMNLSETAFLIAKEGSFDLRWFTPALEVDLCGHATLASAHFLWEDGHVPSTEICNFDTRSGRLTAVKDGDWIEMTLPAKPVKTIDVPEGLSEALGAKPVYVGLDSLNYCLVEVESEAVLRNLEPDFARVAQLPFLAIAATAAAESQDIDFVSRFFAPSAGINEDPVTGSAHCALGPYWRKRLDKSRMTAYQASSRGGFVRVRVDGDKVHIGGQAVTVMRAELIEL